MPTKLLHMLRFTGWILFAWGLFSLYVMYVNRSIYSQDLNSGLTSLFINIVHIGAALWLVKFCGRKLAERNEKSQDLQSLGNVVGGLGVIVFTVGGVVLGGLVLFAMVMFIAAPILTDSSGRWPWQ